MNRKKKRRGIRSVLVSKGFDKESRSDPATAIGTFGVRACAPYEVTVTGNFVNCR
jgi:hypothetical protein